MWPLYGAILASVFLDRDHGILFGPGLHLGYVWVMRWDRCQ